MANWMGSSCTRELKSLGSSVRRMTRSAVVHVLMNRVELSLSSLQVFFASIRSSSNSQVYFMALNRRLVPK